MSTWGWVFEYGLVAIVFIVCVALLTYLWAQDRWWRWQDQRDAKRDARTKRPGVAPKRGPGGLDDPRVSA